jgi:hypothetical protein
MLIEDAVGMFANRYEKIEHKSMSVNLPVREDAPPMKSAGAPSSRGIVDDGWKAKLKKVFCLNIDIQDQNYKLHRQSKMIRQNQKLMMRNQGMTVASGSEGNLTSSKEWKSKHSVWEDDDASSSYVPPRGYNDMKDPSAHAGPWDAWV